MIKAIIFDFGYTLFNPETKKFFDDAEDTLTYLSEKYELIIVSVASSTSSEYRLEQLEKANLKDHFTEIKFALKGEEKYQKYEETLNELHLKPEEVVFVDDLAHQGVYYGNKIGSTTIWVNRDNSKPTEKPTHTITNLNELKQIL